MGKKYVEDREVGGRLRRVRETVRSRSAAPAPIRKQQDEVYLYGNRDLQQFPQLRQSLAAVSELWRVQEQPFRSNVPVVGRLIAWFRERWNRISTRWYILPMLEQQLRFNGSVDRALQDLYRFIQTTSYDLVLRSDAMFYPLDQEQAALHAQFQDLRQGIGELAEEQAAREPEQQAAVQEIRAELAQLSARLDALWPQMTEQEERRQRLAHEQEVDRRGLAFLRMKMDRLMAAVGPGNQVPAEYQEAVEEQREGLRDHDYYYFENIYRNEDEVRQQQETFLPLFEGRSNVLDMGCGKGEFLEMMREHGVAAYGVDLNEQMIRLCQEKGLQVTYGDALAHLAGRPESSLGGLFAAHLVEHLTPHVLADLIQQAYLALQPGAYLVLETPNPLCLWALVNYFYLDMSHVKPVHPQALAFLLETHGFRDVEVRYLHPVPEGVRMVPLPDAPGTPWQGVTALLNTDLQRLNELLYGYADYAIVARK